MAKWKYIRNDTYRRGITIFIGSEENFIKFLETSSYKNDKDLIEEVKDHQNNSNADATCYYDSTEGQCIIRLSNYPSTPTSIATLGHELLHAVFFLLKYCGVKYSDESEEAFTYLHEFFINKALTEKGYKDV